MIFGKRNSDLSDSKLVLKYQKTLNAKYIGFLFDRYGALVFGVCLKYLKNSDDSKDAVIKIFEKIIEDLKNTKVTYFKSWLYMVSKNHCLMILRKKKHDTSNIDDIQLPYEQEELSNFEANELKFNELDKALLQLKESQRLCIMLFYIEELSYDDVSKKTGLSLNEVKSNIQNGKRNLRIYMENHIENKVF